MEQLVARQAHNLEVVRSSRASATTKGLKQNCFKPFLLYYTTLFKSPLPPKHQNYSVIYIDINAFLVLIYQIFLSTLHHEIRRETHTNH